MERRGSTNTRNRRSSTDHRHGIRAPDHAQYAAAYPNHIVSASSCGCSVPMKSLKMIHGSHRNPNPNPKAKPEANPNSPPSKPTKPIKSSSPNPGSTMNRLPPSSKYDHYSKLNSTRQIWPLLFKQLEHSSSSAGSNKSTKISSYKKKGSSDCINQKTKVPSRYNHPNYNYSSSKIISDDYHAIKYCRRGNLVKPLMISDHYIHETAHDVQSRATNYPIYAPGIRAPSTRSFNDHSPGSSMSAKSCQWSKPAIIFSTTESDRDPHVAGSVLARRDQRISSSSATTTTTTTTTTAVDLARVSDGAAAGADECDDRETNHMGICSSSSSIDGGDSYQDQDEDEIPMGWIITKADRIMRIPASADHPATIPSSPSPSSPSPSSYPSSSEEGSSGACSSSSTAYHMRGSTNGSLIVAASIRSSLMRSACSDQNKYSIPPAGASNYWNSDRLVERMIRCSSGGGGGFHDMARDRSAAATILTSGPQSTAQYAATASKSADDSLSAAVGREFERLGIVDIIKG